MKNIIVAASIAAAALSFGCSLPSKAYHGTAAAFHRAGTLKRSEISNQVKVTHRSSELLNTAAQDSVVVLARNAQGPDPQSAQAPYARIAQRPDGANQGISAQDRHLVESLLIQGLLDKGFRSASRLNLREVEVERVFPAGRLSTRALGELFQGDALLLCTVTRLETQPEEYTWTKLLSGQQEKRTIGTRVGLYISLELINAHTSETLHIVTAELEDVLRDPNVERSVLLTETLRKAVSQLPTRKSQTDQTQNQNQR